MKGKLIFKESHSFVGTWIWYMTVLFVLWMCGLFGWGMYQQLILGETWGDKPMDDTMLLIVGISSIMITVAIMAFISLNRLTVEIDEKSIYVKFSPYFNQFKIFQKNDLQEVYVRKYKPILEYGGWGLRVGLKKSKAYNISGNWGLQLVFADGKKLLIGTRKPKELEKAIEKFKAHG